MYLCSLTEKGIDLLPVIEEYVRWNNKYLNDHIAEPAKQFTQMLDKDRESTLIQFIRK